MDIQELTRSFWLEYENVFPKLSKTASIILNSSPSCSTIERFFSEMVSMITPEKNKMTAATMFKRAATRHAISFKNALDSQTTP